MVPCLHAMIAGEERKKTDGVYETIEVRQVSIDDGLMQLACATCSECWHPPSCRSRSASTCASSSVIGCSSSCDILLLNFGVLLGVLAIELCNSWVGLQSEFGLKLARERCNVSGSEQIANAASGADPKNGDSKHYERIKPSVEGEMPLQIRELVCVIPVQVRC